MALMVNQATNISSPISSGKRCDQYWPLKTMRYYNCYAGLQHVLSGILNKLTSHFERSRLINRYGYALLRDRSTCCASLPPDPGEYAG